MERHPLGVAIMQVSVNENDLERVYSLLLCGGRFV